MSFKYSNTELHRFIKQYFEARGGNLTEISEEIFQVKLPNAIAPKEFTYQPLIARERKVALMGTGTPAFQQLLKDSLERGILCSVELVEREPIEQGVMDFFKDPTFGCSDCDIVRIGSNFRPFCIKSPPCYHRVNNGVVKSIRVVTREPIALFQFYYSVTLQSRLRRKSEELVVLLFDETGQYHDRNLVNSLHTELIVSKYTVDTKTFDKIRATADQKIDSIIKNKLSVFDAALVNDVRKKLRAFDKRLKNERREIIFSKKGDEFREAEWKKNHDKLLKNEEQSLKTQVSIKCLNLLIAKTEKITLEIKFSNNSNTSAGFILGVTEPQIQCSVCGKTIFEGYCTEDTAYVCLECVHQSIETGKLYADTKTLILDPFLGEYLEKSEGFICSICGQRVSSTLRYTCSYDSSEICAQHYNTCDKCGRIFSNRNLLTTQRSQKRLCFEHSTQCDICHSTIGLDEYRVCPGSGKKICACTSFVKCLTCGQEYAQNTVIEGKCPACNSVFDSCPISQIESEEAINIVKSAFPSQSKTSKWLIGKNALNTVVIAKGFFSNSLYVVEANQVVVHKTISFLDKLRGR